MKIVERPSVSRIALFLLLSWIAFFVFHGVLMIIDWNLTDFSTRIQPKPGGIPESLDVFLVLFSIAALGIAALFHQPRSWSWWIKVPLSLLQVFLALAIIIVARLLYVLGAGIDTL